jgi:hypothetical protein
MMCVGGGCQPGNNILLPLIPPTLEALKQAAPEPVNKDAPPQDVVIAVLVERDVKTALCPGPIAKVCGFPKTSFREGPLRNCLINRNSSILWVAYERVERAKKPH